MELYVDDILVEKKPSDFTIGRSIFKIDFELGYNEAEPLRIGSKIRLVWKGEPYTLWNGDVKTASYPAEIALMGMKYKFLGGEFCVNNY